MTEKVLDENKIQVGDLVKFTFSSKHKFVQGTVLYVPFSASDSWIVQQILNGKEKGIVYIKDFETCLLLQKFKQEK